MKDGGEEVGKEGAVRREEKREERKSGERRSGGRREPKFIHTLGRWFNGRCNGLLCLSHFLHGLLHLSLLFLGCWALWLYNRILAVIHPSVCVLSRVGEKGKKSKGTAPDTRTKK